MLLNYFKLALRLQLRNPFFTFINVIGLSIGFASFFALWQYSSTQLKTDHHHPGHERIARICTNWDWTDDGESWRGHSTIGSVAPRITPQIVDDFPEVEDYTRILNQPHFVDELVGHNSQVILTYESNGEKLSFKETRAAYAESNVFEFFRLPLVYGDAKSLQVANTIVLSRSTAEKFFSKKNPLGEMLTLNGAITLKVTGVFEDLPGNTHLNFDFLIANASWKDAWDEYMWAAGHNYIRVRENTNLSLLDHKVFTQSEKYYGESQRILAGTKATIFLQPLDHIAFSEDYFADFFRPKSRVMLVGLSAISLLILLMAWANYINLTMARTARRTKEVGTRKMVGAHFSDFVKQFLVESMVVHAISIGLALTVLQATRLPSQTMLNISPFTWNALPATSVIFFSAIIVAGIVITAFYPAVLSVRYSAQSLLAKSKDGRDAGFLQDLLTTFQYTAAIVLILTAFMMAFQLNHILSLATAKNPRTVAVIESPIVRDQENFSRQLDSFGKDLIARGLIKNAALSKSIPGDDYTNYDMIFLSKPEVENMQIGFDSNGGVDEHFIPLFNIKLLAGRNFRHDDRSDAMILSKTAAERMGYFDPANIIGKKFVADHRVRQQWHEVEVIGVVEDYRIRPYFSFKESSSSFAREGTGMCLSYRDKLFPLLTPERLSIEIDSRNIPAVLLEVETLFKETFQGNPFYFHFLDSHINRHYEGDNISRNLILFFSLIAVAIACLGLVGMVSNRIVTKTREIAIRKILGADIRQIAVIVLNATARQVILATAIAIPLAYWLIQSYLEKFSERVELRWWFYTVPVLILVAIMLTSISRIVWKALRENPVESLKYE